MKKLALFLFVLVFALGVVGIANADRFIIDERYGIVTDTVTGLMWDYDVIHDVLINAA